MVPSPNPPKYPRPPSRDALRRPRLGVEVLGVWGALLALVFGGACPRMGTLVPIDATPPITQPLADGTRTHARCVPRHGR